MSKVSKDQKKIYNQRAYEIRKEKKELLKKQKEEGMLEDNIQVPSDSVVSAGNESVVSTNTEVEELEISQSDYNKFLQWQRQQEDIKNTSEGQTTFGGVWG